MAFEFYCLEEEAYYSLEFPGPSDEEIDAHIDACVRHHESAHDAHVDLARRQLDDLAVDLDDAVPF